MKSIYTILVAILITTAVFAQTPEKMSYQAVVRNSSDQLIANQSVGMQISILQSTATGTAIYVETHNTTSNANGLVSLEIGTGTVINGSFATINWANGPYFIKTETDPTGGTNYTITGTSQLMSVPYALHAKTAENVVVYTTNQITSLTPTEGDVVFNSTENLYQIYHGGTWQSFNTNCWPEPTVANAGADQIFTDGTVTTTLVANAPASQHGTGSWSIVNGTGGSFADDTNPTTTFTGTACTTYTLQWTISTNCGNSSDNVNIEFNQTPTTANAGTDQIFTDGTVTTTLAANTSSSGNWSIISGSGGSFTDATNSTTTFTGTLHTVYTLRWSISTNCSNSTDDVTISFNQDGAGSPITDYDGNTYNTVYIGNQLWMTENLNTTHEADGTSIPTVTDDNSDGSTNDEWEALGDNNTDKAYSNSSSGKFYTYAAAKDACPSGWHLPSDAEWTALENYITNDGHAETEGEALKSTTYWADNGNGTDNYGFTAYPVGNRYDGTGTLDGETFNGNWWSSTESSNSSAYFRFLHYKYSYLYRFSFNKSNGFNVRCLKDN